MKWSIAGLLVLGIGAGICASILVASLKIVPPVSAANSQEPQEMQIVVASKALSSMSIVDGRSIELKTVPASEAPKGYLSLPTDVVGKLLIVPIVEGQAFTNACFADEKSGARLASALRNGMRAVSVSLKPEKAGLLYPGCIVDVLVSLNRPSEESGIKEAMSMTLLQGIEVLAIDDTSVMSEVALEEPTAPETATSPPMKRDRKDRLVTLMVNSTQAKALQLASQFGGVSLALRNPLDLAPVETDSTMLSDLADEYSRIVKALQPHVNPSEGGQPRTSENSSVAAAGPTGPPADSDPAAPSRGITKEEFATLLAEHEARKGAEPPPPKVEDPRLDVLVNRAGQIEVVRFKRDAGASLGGLKEGMQWIWEGRALTETRAGGK